MSPICERVRGWSGGGARFASGLGMRYYYCSKVDFVLYEFLVLRALVVVSLVVAGVVDGDGGWRW